MHLSGRVIHRILKLARSIGDMEGTETLTVQQIAEAMQYRSKTMFLDSG